MDDVLADFRHGLRLFRKAPGFSAIAIATLALGIGANTAIFSVIDALLLQPLPYADPDRVSWCGRTRGRWASTATRRRLATTTTGRA
jgi:hypothetical protein